jgi:hypothetical protein
MMIVIKFLIVSDGCSRIGFSERLLPLAMVPFGFQNACCRWRWRRLVFRTHVAVGDGAVRISECLLPLAMAVPQPGWRCSRWRWRIYGSWRSLRRAMLGVRRSVCSSFRMFDVCFRWQR